MTTPSTIKTLWYQLVKTHGTSASAGLVLGISEQRVRQLWNENNSDLPTFEQMLTLSDKACSGVLFDGLARSCEGGSKPRARLDGALDVIQHAATICHNARIGVGDREFLADLLTARRAIDELIDAATDDDPDT